MAHENETGTMADIVAYRLQKAWENLDEARSLCESGFCSGANNRIYYGIFNAILAVHALDRRATSSHKRTIGEFNRVYIHGGIFPVAYSKEIVKIEVVRHSSDYDNFYEADAGETEANLAFARRFVSELENYCRSRLDEQSRSASETSP